MQCEFDHVRASHEVGQIELLIVFEDRAGLQVREELRVVFFAARMPNRPSM